MELWVLVVMLVTQMPDGQYMVAAHGFSEKSEKDCREDGAAWVALREPALVPEIQCIRKTLPGEKTS